MASTEAGAGQIVAVLFDSPVTRRSGRKQITFVSKRTEVGALRGDGDQRQCSMNPYPTMRRSETGTHVENLSRLSIRAVVLPRRVYAAVRIVLNSSAAVHTTSCVSCWYSLGRSGSTREKEARLEI